MHLHNGFLKCIFHYTLLISNITCEKQYYMTSPLNRYQRSIMKSYSIRIALLVIFQIPKLEIWQMEPEVPKSLSLNGFLLFSVPSNQQQVKILSRACWWDTRSAIGRGNPFLQLLHTIKQLCDCIIACITEAMVILSTLTRLWGPGQCS